MPGREYTCLTTYLNEDGTLVVIDAAGAVRDGAVNVTDALAALKGDGWSSSRSTPPRRWSTTREGTRC